MLRTLIAMTACAAMLFMGQALGADKKAKPEKIKTKGTIAVTKEGEGKKAKVTGVTLTAEDGTVYQLHMKKGKGKSLASKDGKVFEVEGKLITGADDEKRLEVTKAKEFKPKKQKPAKKVESKKAADADDDANDDADDDGGDGDAE